ncbi:hypothetical protein GW864_02300 [bacterium]|nr:hypothetical protein [bacterium]
MTKKIFTLLALSVTAISLAGCFAKKDTVITPTVTGDALVETTTPSSQSYEYKNKEK